jgi:hypothetical protein
MSEEHMKPPMRSSNLGAFSPLTAREKERGQMYGGRYAPPWPPVVVVPPPPPPPPPVPVVSEAGAGEPPPVPVLSEAGIGEEPPPVPVLSLAGVGEAPAATNAIKERRSTSDHAAYRARSQHLAQSVEVSIYAPPPVLSCAGAGLGDAPPLQELISKLLHVAACARYPYHAFRPCCFRMMAANGALQGMRERVGLDVLRKTTNNGIWQPCRVHRARS